MDEPPLIRIYIPTYWLFRFFCTLMYRRPESIERSQQMPEFVRHLTQFQQDLYLYVRSLLPDPDAAADVVQEANVVLWEKREQFQIGTNFRAWAFQISRYKVMQHTERCGGWRPDSAIRSSMNWRASPSGGPPIWT